MSHFLVAVLLTILLLPNRPAGQRKVTDLELGTLMNEQRQAVTLYREGRTAEALAVVQRQTASMNHMIAQRILAWIENPEPQMRDARRELVQHWPLQLVTSLGALHMERALQVYMDRGGIDTYRAHVRTGRMLFDDAARRGYPAADLPRRWVLAIGATAHADGQLWWAAGILDDGCREYLEDADLLVACGSVHEALAGLPAHALLSAGAADDEAPMFGVQAAQDARAARNRHLAAAHRMLEAALKVRPNDVEARLRLANVFSLSGDPSRAMSLLESILGTEGQPERRSAFLSRLFLGRLRLQAGATQEAVTLLEQSIEVVPSAHSGYIALAHALNTSGRAVDGAAVIERMFRAPAEPPDPWGSYGYGQYWLPEPLLEAVRAEARK